MNFIEPAVVIRVRRSDERAIAIGDDEHHSAVVARLEENAATVRETRKDHMDALRRTQGDPLSVEGGEIRHALDPRARGVDKKAGGNLKLRRAELVRDARGDESVIARDESVD